MDLETQLKELCQQIYQENTLRLKPRYPWVLVRVLPKETVSHGIILPQSQNKIIHEGIVLETWETFSTERVENGNKVLVYNRSSVRRGDRVAFAHFEGLPVPFLDETHYRIVREVVNQRDYPNCGILGRIECEQDTEIPEKLNHMFKGINTISVSGE